MINMIAQTEDVQIIIGKAGDMGVDQYSSSDRWVIGFKYPDTAGKFSKRSEIVPIPIDNETAGKLLKLVL